MSDDMKRVIKCKHCGKPEYYGEFRWMDGKMLCRDCYKAEYEKKYGHPYKWRDLDGERPNTEAVECCKKCEYFHKLKHGFIRGDGFVESYCCDVLLHFDKKDEHTYVMEVTEEGMCEMYSAKGGKNERV